MQKFAYPAMMSYEVSAPEKQQAEKAMRWFDFCLALFEQCDDHLNLIYNPFKKNENIAPDKIFERRAMLRGYRDEVIKKFNKLKTACFKAYATVQMFTSDTEIEKLMNSFVASVEDIEIQVNRLVDLFSDLKNPDFVKGVISGIDHIKKEKAQFDQLIDERLKNHIKTNILNRNWVDNVSTELKQTVEKRSPLALRLVEQRQQMLDRAASRKT